MKVLVSQLCPTLWDPMDCSPPGPSIHEYFAGKNTRVGCHSLLQGIFPTQGSNPSLLHCRQILYRLSHQRRLLPCIRVIQQLSDMFLVYLSHSVDFLEEPEGFRRVRKSFFLPATIFLISSSPSSSSSSSHCAASGSSGLEQRKKREDTDRRL